MRDLAKKAVVGSGLLRVASYLRGGGAAILMYHSVMPEPDRHDDFLGGTVHSRKVFRSQMELIARRYHPVSLDQVWRFVRGEGRIPKHAVAITFDDGYSDNYEVAAPVLNEVGLPATFYATVNCVEKRELPWPARLRFIFRNTNNGSWTDSAAKAWPLGSDDARENALLRSCDECCQLVGTAQESYVAHIGQDLKVEVPAEGGALMMTYDQLRVLVRQGHVVGSHTMCHPNMAYLNETDARREMTESKQRLEQQLGIFVGHFSYPCPALSPHWSEQTVIASRDVGYQTAVTTDGGLACKSDNPFRLRRVRPTKTVEGLSWNLQCAFAGRGM